MCFVVARVLKAFLIFFAYFLSFVSGGTIYASLTGSLPYAGPVCTLVFVIVWYNRNVFAQLIRRASPANAPSSVWHRYLLFGVAWVICMQLFYAYRVSRPGVSTTSTLWTILGAWFLFFCGALMASPDAGERFERVLPPQARAVPEKKTIIIVESLDFTRELKRVLSVATTRMMGGPDDWMQSSSWKYAHNMVTSCAMHRDGIESLRFAHLSKEKTAVIPTPAFVASFAMTASLYVDGKISEREWQDYKLHYGENPLDMLKRTTLSNFPVDSADCIFVYVLTPFDEPHVRLALGGDEVCDQIQTLFLICIESLVRAAVNKKICLINVFPVATLREADIVTDALTNAVFNDAPPRCDVESGQFSKTLLTLSASQTARWSALCEELCGTAHTSPYDAYVGLCKVYNKSIDRKVNKKSRKRKE